MIAELERVTGGRAEIGSFHVVPFHMQVEVRNITVHGSEAASDIPLVHADHLVARVKVISFLRAQFGFHSLTLEHPVVHIAIAADGSTNVPAPKVPLPPSQDSPVEQLFALSIDHLSMLNGELIWGNRRIPLDLAVHDATLQMDYSFLRGRYESHLALGKVDTTLRGPATVLLDDDGRFQPGDNVCRRENAAMVLRPVAPASQWAGQQFCESADRCKLRCAHRSSRSGCHCAAGTICAKATPNSRAAATGPSRSSRLPARLRCVTWAGRTIRLHSGRPTPPATTR